MNSSCYHFQTRYYEKGFLDNSVDATYIIHLEGNGRYEHIQNQLSTYHPTKHVHILINKGFKKCHKNIPDQVSTYDLVDAFLHIFEHANDNGYDNILVLEDDFIFDTSIHNSRICSDISTFLNDYKHTSIVYYLGCLPFIRTGSFSTHNRILLSAGTQSCIYSKKTREYALMEDRAAITDWDIYLNSCPHLFSRYGYYRPLCNQLHIDTENSDNWWNPLGLADFVKKIKKLFKMDTQLEPGHQFFYMFSLFIFWLILIILLLILIIWLINPYANGLRQYKKGRSL